MSLTDEQTAQLTRLALAGLTLQQIKKHYPDCARSDISSHLRALGFARKANDWTAAEDTIIEEALAAGQGWRVVLESHRLPGRSGHAIRGRMSSLKVRRAAAPSYGALADLKNADAILTTHWPAGTPIDQIACMLPGWSGGRIRDRAQHLNLQRPQSPTSWSDRAVGILVTEYPRGTPFEDIAALIPEFKDAQIRRKVRALNLKRPESFLSDAASRSNSRVPRRGRSS